VLESERSISSSKDFVGASGSFDFNDPMQAKRMSFDNVAMKRVVEVRAAENDASANIKQKRHRNLGSMTTTEVERTLKMFNELDQDGDGVLSKAEIEATMRDNMYLCIAVHEACGLPAPDPEQQKTVDFTQVFNIMGVSDKKPIIFIDFKDFISRRRDLISKAQKGLLPGNNQARAGDKQDALEALFAAVDHNGDGDVTKYELLRALNRDQVLRDMLVKVLGLPKKVSSLNAKNIFETVFDCVDVDNTQTISLAELQDFIEDMDNFVAMQYDQNLPPQVQTLLAAADKNQDGSLSNLEIIRALNNDMTLRDALTSRRVEEEHRKSLFKQRSSLAKKNPITVDNSNSSIQNRVATPCNASNGQTTNFPEVVVRDSRMTSLGEEDDDDEDDGDHRLLEDHVKPTISGMALAHLFEKKSFRIDGPSDSEEEDDDDYVEEEVKSSASNEERLRLAERKEANSYHNRMKRWDPKWGLFENLPSVEHRKKVHHKSTNHLPSSSTQPNRKLDQKIQRTLSVLSGVSIEEDGAKTGELSRLNSKECQSPDNIHIDRRMAGQFPVISAQARAAEKKKKDEEAKARRSKIAMKRFTARQTTPPNFYEIDKDLAEKLQRQERKMVQLSDANMRSLRKDKLDAKILDAMANKPGALPVFVPSSRNSSKPPTSLASLATPSVDSTLIQANSRMLRYAPSLQSDFSFGGSFFGTSPNSVDNRDIDPMGSLISTAVSAKSAVSYDKVKVIKVDSWGSSPAQAAARRAKERNRYGDGGTKRHHPQPFRKVLEHEHTMREFGVKMPVTRETIKGLSKSAHHHNARQSIRMSKAASSYRDITQNNFNPSVTEASGVWTLRTSNQKVASMSTVESAGSIIEPDGMPPDTVKANPQLDDVTRPQTAPQLFSR